MMKKFTNLLKPTLSEAFEVGKIEGQKEALAEIKSMLEVGVSSKAVEAYIKARIKTIQDFSANNPFKQKE